MATQPSLFPTPSAPRQRTFDVCRNRHKGNVQSVDANPSDSHKEVMRDKILAFIKSRGIYGATSGEIEREFKLAKNRFSGRLTELQAKGLIFKNESKPREGCSVFVAGV